MGLHHEKGVVFEVVRLRFAFLVPGSYLRSPEHGRLVTGAKGLRNTRNTRKKAPFEVSSSCFFVRSCARQSVARLRRGGRSERGEGRGERIAERRRCER